MFEYLAAYLEVVTPPEQRDLILTGCEQLVDLGIEGHVFEIDQQLELAENADTTITVHSITTLIEETQRAVLDRLGVELHDNLPLAMINDVLAALDGLTRYEDREAIIEIIDQGHTTLDTLADLLPLLGRYKAPDYQLAIMEVNENVILTLKEIAVKGLDEYDDLPSPEVVSRARQRLRSYLKRHRGTIVEEAIRNEEIRLGYDAQSLIDTLDPKLHELTASAFGQEIACVFLASGTPNDELSKAIQDEIESYFGDIREAMAAQQTSQQVLSEVTYE